MKTTRLGRGPEGWVAAPDKANVGRMSLSKFFLSIL